MNKNLIWIISHFPCGTPYLWMKCCLHNKRLRLTNQHLPSEYFNHQSEASTKTRIVIKFKIKFGHDISNYVSASSLSDHLLFICHKWRKKKCHGRVLLPAMEKKIKVKEHCSAKVKPLFSLAWKTLWWKLNIIMTSYWINRSLLRLYERYTCGSWSLTDNSVSFLWGVVTWFSV